MDKLWIVFRNKEPSTAHLSLEEAEMAGQRAIRRGDDTARYSIWTATLDANGVGNTDGIPIFSTTEGPKETFGPTARCQDSPGSRKL